MPQSFSYPTTHEAMNKRPIAVMAFCPVDEAGTLQTKYIQHYRHNVLVPPGCNWHIMPVIISPMAMDYYADAPAEADDANLTTAAMLGGQADDWTGELT